MSLKTLLLKNPRRVRIHTYSLICFSILTLWAPTPKTGQTHSKQFVGCCRRLVWVCLTIMWVWRWKGQRRSIYSYIVHFQLILFGGCFLKSPQTLFAYILSARNAHKILDCVYTFYFIDLSVLLKWWINQK